MLNVTMPMSKRALFTSLLILNVVSVLVVFPYYIHLLQDEYRTLMKGFDDSGINNDDEVKSSFLRLIPLCTDGILDKRIVNKNPAPSDEIRLPLSSHNSCRLHHYTKSDVVQCVEALRKSQDITRNRTAINNQMNDKLHVAFIGDSRIRHMYHGLFLSLFPLIENSCPEATMSHRDICVQDPLMDVYFTYLWGEKYNQNYTKVLTNWIEGRNTPPNYLVTGSTAHHVQEKKQKILDYTLFENNVTDVATLLTKLSEKFGTRIIWWNDDVAPNTFDEEASFVNLDKIVQRVFKENKTPVQIWDSSNDLFMDYIKTCEMNLGRKVPWVNRHFGAHPNSWLNCDDIIHAPQAYTFVQVQTIVNDLCNHALQTKI